MRIGRWLILAALVAIVAFVGDTYMKRKALLDKDAPAAPPPLESGISARGNNWCYTQSEGDHPRVEVCAARNTQLSDPSVMELDGVQLKLYQKGSTRYDFVQSDKAQFDIHQKTLYSDGDVEITLGVNSEGPPHGRIVKIHGSGV